MQFCEVPSYFISNQNFNKEWNMNDEKYSFHSHDGISVMLSKRYLKGRKFVAQITVCFCQWYNGILRSKISINFLTYYILKRENIKYDCQITQFTSQIWTGFYICHKYHNLYNTSGLVMKFIFNTCFNTWTVLL